MREIYYNFAVITRQSEMVYCEAEYLSSSQHDAAINIFVENLCAGICLKSQRKNLINNVKLLGFITNSYIQLYIISLIPLIVLLHASVPDRLIL